MANIPTARCLALLKATFGREYCVRQWIVSPSSDATFEKMLEAVDRLAVEFGSVPSARAAL